MADVVTSTGDSWVSNEQRMRMAGGWTTADSADKVRPTKIHATPGDDQDLRAALENLADPLDITPSMGVKYTSEDLMGMMAASMSMIAKQLGRSNGTRTFRLDVAGVSNGMTSQIVRGIIRTIHNSSPNSVVMALAEQQSADPFFNATIPAGTLLYCYIPFNANIYVTTFTPTGTYARVMVGGEIVTP